MEAVAMDALVRECPRQPGELSEAGQPVVKRGVETGDLRQIRPRAPDGGDAGQVVRQVQGRERD